MLPLLLLLTPIRPQRLSRTLLHLTCTLRITETRGETTLRRDSYKRRRPKLVQNLAQQPVLGLLKAAHVIINVHQTAFRGFTAFFTCSTGFSTSTNGSSSAASSTDDTFTFNDGATTAHCDMNSADDNRNHSPAGGFTNTHSAPNHSTGTNAPLGTRSYTVPSTTTSPKNAANATASPPGVHLNASPHCVLTPTSTPDPEPTTGTSLLDGSQRNISPPNNKNCRNSSTTESPYATVTRHTAENTASQHQAGRQAPNPTPALVSNGGATWPETGPGAAQQGARTQGTGFLHKTRHDHTPPPHGEGNNKGRGSNRAQTHHNSEATPNTQNQPPPAPTPKKHRKIRARIRVTGGWGPRLGPAGPHVVGGAHIGHVLERGRKP